MVGKTISHYKILEKLGEGGMGVVYKAKDTKLERTVAIKFLPRQIAVNSEERERFKIEAKAAASLNHPNIATIHAIEEVDGDTFIVMEYIKGKELRELTTDDRELSIEDVTNYATQIAEGLKAAHEEDVTHRDIKSANIMITDKGQVKIMDFGLAKVRGGSLMTKVGTTLGTAAYMSPEQARYTVIWHRARKELGITINEYCLADTVHRLSGNRSSVPGWCYAKKEQLAESLGFSRQAIHSMAKNLIKKNIIEKNIETGYLRTTNLWYERVETFKERLNNPAS